MRVEIDEIPQLRFASLWHLPSIRSCGRNDSRASEPVEGDVEVTEDGQNKSVMDADAVGKRSLRQWNNCTTYDGCNQKSGSLAGKRSQLCNTQRKDSGKHNGVEEADEQDAPHGKVPEGQHGDDDQ